MQAEKDLKKGAGICLDTVKLDEDLYRLGHTKVFNYFEIFSFLIHTPTKKNYFVPYPKY